MQPNTATAEAVSVHPVGEEEEMTSTTSTITTEAIVIDKHGDRHSPRDTSNTCAGRDYTQVVVDMCSLAQLPSALAGASAVCLFTSLITTTTLVPVLSGRCLLIVPILVHLDGRPVCLHCVVCLF